MSTEQYSTPKFTPVQKAAAIAFWVSLGSLAVLAFFEVWIGAGIAAAAFVISAAIQPRLHQTPAQRQLRKDLAEATYS